MKRMLIKLAGTALMALLIVPATVMAQEKPEKPEKAEKAEKAEKKEAEQIIITKKGDINDKYTIVVDGDKITVNGKPVEDLKKEGITVRRSKIRDMWAYGGGNSSGGTWNMNGNGNNVLLFNEDSNRAMLGVSTENNEDKGAEVQEVTEGSAADKAGIKKGDIITMIDDKKISGPDDLSTTIQDHKPGDKVTVTFLRDSKEQKMTVELGKWKGVKINGFTMTPDQNFNFNMPEFKMEELQPRMQELQRSMPLIYGVDNNRPKLGLSVQDTEDGKGVKVIDVDDESNAAKAGVKEDDIITQVNDKEVNSADEVAKIVRENRDKPSLTLKVKRGSKTQTIEVKMPRKLKTAEL